MKRVLIVEDEPMERRAVARFLQLEGFEVVAVGSGAEALARLAAEPFNTAVIDVMMPGVSGLALARMIASRHADVALILTSAYHLSARQLERLDIGPVRFVNKPVRPDTLLAALRAEPSGAPGAPDGPDARGTAAGCAP